MLRDAWDASAEQWVAWARAPGHDTYWRFHRSAFLPLIPPPGRLTVDLGCGEGRLARDLLGLGHQVVGIDASPKMATATRMHPDSSPGVVVADAAALPLPAAVADCVIAFMSLQDIDGMEEAVAEAGRVLGSGGRLVIAIPHPLNSAGGFAPDLGAGSRPFVIDRSWYERRSISDTSERDGLTMTFHSEHRPIRDYTDALFQAGFLIEKLQEVGEPDPADKWSRLPLFLHLGALRI